MMSRVVFHGRRSAFGHGVSSAAGTVGFTTFGATTVSVVVQPPKIGRYKTIEVSADIRIPVIAAAFTYTGLPPDEMAGRITTLYERVLTTTVNDIEHIEANSYRGFGIVKIFFQPGVDVATANAQVTAVSQTVLKQMPAGTTPPLILNYNASTVPILQLALSGEGLHNLVQNMKAQQPDFVAVTGDLVNLGLEAEANTAWNWLQTVGDEHAVCVSPGNHDAYVKPAFGFNAERWGGYMRGETMDVAQFPFVRRVDDVAVISCSSSVPSAPFMAIGRFEQDQADRLARILKLMGEAGYFRVVLIHHPPNIEARDKRLGLWGGDLFRSVIAEHGAELILHGHTHKSSIHAVPGPGADVPVIGVAAAGAAQGTGHNGDDPARYNFFRIERTGNHWSCTMREYGFQRLGPSIVMRLQMRIY